MLRKAVAFVFLAILAALMTWQAPAAVGQDAKIVLGNVSKSMGADNLQDHPVFRYGYRIRLRTSGECEFALAEFCR